MVRLKFKKKFTFEAIKLVTKQGIAGAQVPHV